MEGNWMFAAAVFGAVAIATAAIGWNQWLEHQRRMKALEVIKVALERDKEAPEAVYQELAKAGAAKPPWSEVVAFSALSAGFWIAYARADNGDDRTRFLVVAATFAITALGCLVLALKRPAKRSDDIQ